MAIVDGQPADADTDKTPATTNGKYYSQGSYAWRLPEEVQMDDT